MRETVLAIQGPPGTGKSYTGAKLILALLREGKKVGVTAVSHKVIRSLLKKVYEFACEEKVETQIQFFHKHDQTDDCPPWLTEIDDNSKAVEQVAPGAVLGATAYLWVRSEAVDVKLDYLVVDEAGQMSLANVLAASRCASNIILLGDPQQLEQPQKGAHPEGADIAALTHLLAGQQTIASEKGIFLGETYRLHPAITRFTSEVYYEGRLSSVAGLEKQRLNGNHPYTGSGLFYKSVPHKDRQTHCEEEALTISSIVHDLVANATWTDKNGQTKPLIKEDILIVAPYNAQVKLLKEKLPGYSIGTVDKFQGQEAAAVIYSMTCSSAADAPRGMSFLYSPNRLNVATSRAQCVSILVASPKIFEAECRSIEQMMWVNGVCRYLEMATISGNVA